MKVHDIVLLNSNAAKYVILELWEDTGKPKEVLYEPYWEKCYNNKGNLEILKVTILKNAKYNWTVVGSVKVEEMEHPNWKVIQKIKQMDSKRKELGYVF